MNLVFKASGKSSRLSLRSPLTLVGTSYPSLGPSTPVILKEAIFAVDDDQELKLVNSFVSLLNCGSMFSISVEIIFSVFLASCFKSLSISKSCISLRLLKLAYTSCLASPLKGSQAHKSYSVGNNVSSATLAYACPYVHSLIRISIKIVFWDRRVLDTLTSGLAGTGNLNASKKTKRSGSSS